MIQPNRLNVFSADFTCGSIEACNQPAMIATHSVFSADFTCGSIEAIKLHQTMKPEEAFSADFTCGSIEAFMRGILTGMVEVFRRFYLRLH